MQEYSPFCIPGSILSSLAFHLRWDRASAPPEGIFPWLIDLMARGFPPLNSPLLFSATSLIVKPLYIIPLYCWCLHLSMFSSIKLLQFVLLLEFSYILNSSKKKKNPTCLWLISTAALLRAEFLLPSLRFGVEHCRIYFMCNHSTLCTRRLAAQLLTRVYAQPYSTSVFWCMGLCMLTTNWEVRQSVSAKKEFSVVCEMLL